jgi:hypothetical protein
MNIKRTLRNGNYCAFNNYLKGSNVYAEFNPLCLRTRIAGKNKWVAINNTDKEQLIKPSYEGGSYVGHQQCQDIKLFPGEALFTIETGTPTRFAKYGVISVQDLDDYIVSILNTNNNNKEQVEAFMASL